MKTCFGCKHTLPLFFFADNRMKFKLKTDKGKVKKCRFCVAKEACAGEVMRRKGKSFIAVKLTKWEIIKEFFRK